MQLIGLFALALVLFAPFLLAGLFRLASGWSRVIEDGLRSNEQRVVAHQELLERIERAKQRSAAIRGEMIARLAEWNEALH